MSVNSSDLLGSTVGAITQLNSFRSNIGTINTEQLP